MKNIYWILFLFSFQSYSQKAEWFDFKIDSLVKFKLPTENAELFESNQDGIKMYELSAERNKIIFSGNKIKDENLLLPYNHKDLITLYDDALSSILENYPKAKVNKQEIETNGFIGLKLILTDNNNNRLFESEIFLIENNYYLFDCLYNDGIIITESDYFFNQISLPNNTEINQLTGKSNLKQTISIFKTELLILFGIIGLIILIIIINKRRKTIKKSYTR